jgi:hypothetical protein
MHSSAKLPKELNEVMTNGIDHYSGGSTTRKDRPVEPKSNAARRSREFAQTRISQLNASDRLLVSRARKLQRFMTTPFFVAEPYTHKPAKYVPRIETVRGCRMTLDGQLDSVPEERLLYIGTIDEALIPPPSP